MTPLNVKALSFHRQKTKSNEKFNSIGGKINNNNENEKSNKMLKTINETKIRISYNSAKVKNLYSKSYLQNNHLFMSFFLNLLYLGFFLKQIAMICSARMQIKHLQSDSFFVSKIEKKVLNKIRSLFKLKKRHNFQSSLESSLKTNEEFTKASYLTTMFIFILFCSFVFIDI